MRRIAAVALATLLALPAAGAALAQIMATSSQVQTPVDSRDTVVITGMVPIPDVGEGAPLYTSHDVQQITQALEKAEAKAKADFHTCAERAPGVQEFCDIHKGIAGLLACEEEYASKAGNLAGKAEQATQKAEDVRRAAARGQADTAAVEAAEFERQVAVRKLQTARADFVEAQAMIGDWQQQALSQGGGLDMFSKSARRRKENVGLGLGPPQQITYLQIRNVKAHQLKDQHGKPFVRVTGDLVSTTDRSAPIPGLSVALVDERGWVLHSQVVAAEHRKSIGPGKTSPFAIDVREAPDLLKSAIVTFAPEHAPEPRLSVGLFCRA